MSVSISCVNLMCRVLCKVVNAPWEPHAVAKRVRARVCAVCMCVRGAARRHRWHLCRHRWQTCTCKKMRCVTPIAKKLLASPDPWSNAWTSPWPCGFVSRAGGSAGSTARVAWPSARHGTLPYSTGKS